ncbi:MAG: Cys-tRNA(Pro) deacylase [Clostridia bacterium]|nr:Cys-tRNA(Pro) deacylase [Clostridia bacterium]
MKKIEKTNVMRILDSIKADYTPHCYEGDGETNGIEVAKKLGIEPSRVFKTLVTVGNDKEHYVFVIPVNKELNLKKAAVAVGIKNIDMVKSKDLLPLTGYVHGGCSPIGMKKQFRTTLDMSALQYEKILFSAGKIGFQVETSPNTLSNILPISFSNLVN